MPIQVLRNAESKYIFVFRPSFVPFARGKWTYSIPEVLFLGEYLGKLTCYNHYTWNTHFVKSSTLCFCHKAFLLDLLTLAFTSPHSNQAFTSHTSSATLATVPVDFLVTDFPEHWLESNFQDQVLPLSSDPAGEKKNRSAQSCRCKLGWGWADQVVGFANQSLTSVLLQTHLNKYSAYTDLISLHS